jgi:hypothetical protein
MDKLNMGRLNMEGFLNKLKNNIKFRNKYSDIIKINSDNIENDIIGIKGLYFGYPRCCIKYFIEHKENLPQICLDASEDYGFFPCESCSVKVFNNKIKLTKLIKKRYCKINFLDYINRNDNNELHNYFDLYFQLFEQELSDNPVNPVNPVNPINPVNPVNPIQIENEINNYEHVLKNNSNLKKITKYFKSKSDDEEFKKHIVKIDGKYWGYPICCIKYFIKSKGYSKSDETISELSKRASGNTGFYPCEIHSQHIIDKFFKIEDLIKKNRKDKNNFPLEDKQSNIHYLLGTLNNI